MVSTVYQRDRKASNFEYFSRAVAIRNEITRLMASERVCPKRYRLLIGVPTVNTARELVYFCNKADSFYPSNSFNVLERKRYLTLAVAACDQLTQDLECLNNLDVVKDKGCLERVSAMIGDEDLNEDLEDGDYFGFCVDAGMGCIADVETQKAFREYWAKRLEEDEDIDPYNDLFCDLLEESYNENPRYQREGGDWVNWTVPGTDLSIPIFASGWGDGVYPCYFGYDSDGNVSGVYILFIEIEDDSKE